MQGVESVCFGDGCGGLAWIWVMRSGGMGEISLAGILLVG